MKNSKLGLILLTLPLWVGCTHESKVELSSRSKIKVTLPAKPALVRSKYRRTYDDGVMTVLGLLNHRDSYLKTTLKVRGVITGLALCPATVVPKTPRRRGRKGDAEPAQTWDCKRPPYALLADPGGKKSQVLRIGGQMNGPLAHLTKGATVTLTGFFDLVSPDGKYVDQQGLLFLKSSSPSK